jgi:hypothetical protein
MTFSYIVPLSPQIIQLYCSFITTDHSATLFLYHHTTFSYIVPLSPHNIQLYCVINEQYSWMLCGEWLYYDILKNKKNLLLCKSFFCLLDMRTKHNGTCLTQSSFWRKAWMGKSCVNGFCTTLNVPSKYQRLAFCRRSSCCCVANITWRFWKRKHNIKRIFLLNNYTLGYMYIIIIIKYKANILLFFLLLQIDTDFLNCEDFLVSDPTPCYVCHTAATRPSTERQTMNNIAECCVVNDCIMIF